MNDRGYLEFCDILERTSGNVTDMIWSYCRCRLSFFICRNEGWGSYLIASAGLYYMVWKLKQLDVFSFDTISLGHLTSHYTQLCMCHQYVFIVDCWNYWHYSPTRGCPHLRIGQQKFDSSFYDSFYILENFSEFLFKLLGSISMSAVNSYIVNFLLRDTYILRLRGNVKLRYKISDEFVALSIAWIVNWNVSVTQATRKSKLISLETCQKCKRHVQPHTNIKTTETHLICLLYKYCCFFSKTNIRYILTKDKLM